MCGIVGVAGPHEVEWVRTMNAALVHRGPDDHGLYQSPDHNVALAMRRLSILDLTGGHQPMSNHDATLWVVFNGEIYNSPELRRRLETEGRRFRTLNSDTEVLLQLYEARGPSFVSELNGMFAFVIYDQRRNLLFGARDRVGIKPLYYTHRGGRFAWASELKALLTLPWVGRDCDPQSISHYMTLGYVPGTRSIWSDIHRVPAAHTFTYDLSRQRLELQPFWRIQPRPNGVRSEEEAAEQLRFELHGAVKRWSLSDVPLACSLSGGLDSSAIVGLLADNGCPRVRTYSVGFEGDGESQYNEMPLARQVAERFGTDHHEIVLKPQDLLDDLVAMVWSLEEPYGGGLPSWYVFREMARDVKVAFTGTGGDELFGNYGRFRRYEADSLISTAIHFRQAFTGGADTLAALAGPLGAVTARLSPQLRWIGRGRLLSRVPNLLRQPFGQHYPSCEYMPDSLKSQAVFSMATSGLEGTADYMQRVFDSVGARDLRTGLAAVDCQTLLADEFLLMTDRFSMAYSLEARVPFLDHEFIEFAFGLPASIRTSARDPKYLLKRAVRDLLPPDLLAAPKKGFVIPTELWLRRELKPLVRRLLAPQRLAKQNIFRPDFYRAFVEPHLGGATDNHLQIWSALMYQLWHEVFVEQRATSPPTFTWRDLC